MLGFLPLYIITIVKSPDTWDRLLGISLLSVKVVVIMIIVASYYETAYILDIAIACTLLNFVFIIFSSHFLRERKKGGGKT
jgi:multicomponent Na+:H+ antiporter subunit F